MSLYNIVIPLQGKMFITTKKVIAITTKVVVIRCSCNDKKVDVSRCNKIRGNRFMPHLIFVAIIGCYFFLNKSK